MFKKPFVILDLETSGIDPKHNDIIEVAMIRYENGKKVNRYSSLIKIDYELPEIITVITGITDDDIKKDGRDKMEVLAEVEKFLSGAYLLGHNPNFDFSFLKAAKINLDILGVIDTIPLSQIIFPQFASYSLESLSDDLNISHENSHRAMSDVEATLSLFKILLKEAEKLPKNLITEIHELLLQSEWKGGVFFDEIKGNSKDAMTSSCLQDNVSLSDHSVIKKPLSVSEVFGDGGGISRVMDAFEARPSQTEMAENVSNAFAQEYHLVCEAPTGVGKSLAYLSASADVAIREKTKVVISTNTINLQDQLFGKDIPLLRKVYKEMTDGDGPVIALLKGRSHYLCLRRFTEFKRRSSLTQEELILLIKILVWQYRTKSGGSDDIHLARHEVLIWNLELSADQKFCTPNKCKAFGECYLHKARREAEEADIIIVNHSLLCADLESEGSILPDYEYIVVDEAHHLEEVATKSLGLEIKQENISIPVKSIQNHLKDFTRRFSGTLFTDNDISELAGSLIEDVPDIQQMIANFFDVVAIFVNRNTENSGFIENILIDKIVMGTEEWVNLGESLSGLNDKLVLWSGRLKKFAEALEISDKQYFSEQDSFRDELIQEIGILFEQFGHLHNFFAEDHENGEWIRWLMLDMSGIISVNMAPLTVGSYLKDKLYDQKKSVILTSATLGIQLSQDDMDNAENHPFTYIRKMLGLDESFEEIILDSPFDYEKQVYVITPSDLIPVIARNSLDQAGGFMKDFVKKVGGGILGLFTSHNALENVYMRLKRELSPKDAKILAQRLSGGRAKILKAYMNNPKHSVLLGTNSFWEGVDIPGDALTTLVMHKIPFDVPSDPIHKVRGQMFQNGFMEYSVPRAVLKFRQGFGRLIRSKKDYGVMILLDDRFTKKQYGQLFLDALPDGVVIEKMKLEEVPAQVKQWLGLMRQI